MTCNRDKNPLKVKDLHLRNTIACRALGGGNLRKDLQS